MVGLVQGTKCVMVSGLCAAVSFVQADWAALYGAAGDKSCITMIPDARETSPGRGKLSEQC